MDSQLSEKKLILLYLISKSDTITPTELSDFVLFRGYMDYFSMQNYMEELVESELVVYIKSEDQLYYTLHPQGDEVVELFRARIPHSIREDINTYTKNSFLHGSPLLEAEAIIERKPDDQYQVLCRIMDYDRTVLELKASAVSEEAANTIRNHWRQKGMNIYWNLLKEVN